jgi:4-oxalomesaconate hydratase
MVARIVAFGAHPGDAFGSVGGTIAKHVRKGDEVSIVTLTCGERSHSHIVWEEYAEKQSEESVLKRAKEIKKAEFEKASNLLGVKDARILDFGDDPLIVDRARLHKVVDVLRELRPDIVLVHTDQGHVDHETTWDIVRNACRIAGDLGVRTQFPPFTSIKNIYYCSPWYMGGWDFKPDIFVDIHEVIGIKTEALAVFKSQRTTPQMARDEVFSAAYWWGSMWFPAEVEAFRSFRPPIFPYLPDPSFTKGIGELEVGEGSRGR